MHNVKPIRERLELTQKAFADALGCTQGNVANYERGQTPPPKVALKVTEVAAARGLPLTMGQVYGVEPLPDPAIPEINPPQSLSGKAPEATNKIASKESANAA